MKTIARHCGDEKCIASASTDTGRCLCQCRGCCSSKAKERAMMREAAKRKGPPPAAGGLHLDV